MKTLLDNGNGVGDGVSINICYINRENESEKPTMYNIEVAPPRKLNDNPEFETVSQVSAKCVTPGEIYVHCNRLVWFSSLR